MLPILPLGDRVRKLEAAFGPASRAINGKLMEETVDMGDRIDGMIAFLEGHKHNCSLCYTKDQDVPFHNLMHCPELPTSWKPLVKTVGSVQFTGVDICYQCRISSLGSDLLHRPFTRGSRGNCSVGNKDFMCGLVLAIYHDPGLLEEWLEFSGSPFPTTSERLREWAGRSHPVYSSNFTSVLAFWANKEQNRN